jgi:hypothetical protein
MCGGRREIEVQRIADVEGQNLVPLLGDLVGNAGQVADGVTDVFEDGWRRERFRDGSITRQGARSSVKIIAWIEAESL